ncbi:sensor histidine kinase [Streptomyces litchfieldiae]|uniref:histidine kinase n=1 Tax=Streptomyces litchfieldiae TaxID=3075543 RepID=A0ABU2MV42_9ACTN|nr:sensor histidine kinase [Streptomyces sp. DSM 44938]MDT0345267.1 sensor histidine kinase [Streptomyces sp. DSM 44938]
MLTVRELLRSEEPEHRILRRDTYIALGVGALCAFLGAAVEHDGNALDPLGWLLLAGTVVPLAWRRLRPMPVLIVGLAFAATYHRMDYNHVAPFLASALAVYTVAAVGPRRRTLAMAGVVMAVIAVVWTQATPVAGRDMLQSSGWILAVIAFGEAVRLHHQYLAAMRERAERAERTREQEAARRVAEERVRIARDLHDLLAHSITLIGVRASVAAHLLVTDPGRLDRDAVAEALESISATCRDARADLRTTLQVLRGDDQPGSGPLPGLAGLLDLARAAETAGARVELSVDADDTLPPVVSAAAYRIVQEALTNAVRHAGPQVGIRVAVRRDGPTLSIRVADDGGPRAGAPADPAGPPGYGIAGMRERATSIGGSLAARPRSDAPGFVVTAELPAEEAVR